jgi:hypothetical protein
MIVKLFLIGSVLAIVVWLLRARPGAQRLAVTRLAGLLLALGWITAVLNPGLVSWVANRMGVGRGADLVLYVLVVVFTFSSIGQYQRIRVLDDRLAELARAQALLEHELRQHGQHGANRHG